MATLQPWYVAKGEWFWISRGGALGGQSEKFGFLECESEESNIIRHIMVCGVKSYRKNFRSEI